MGGIFIDPAEQKIHINDKNGNIFPPKNPSRFSPYSTLCKVQK